MTILSALSCDKDDFFDEFEVDITINGDIIKFNGNLFLISYQDEDVLLFSSEDITSDGFGNYYPTETGFYKFYTSTHIDTILVQHSFSLTNSALQDENWSDYALTVDVTVRRNGSEIDNVTMVYGGESSPEGFDNSYSIN